MLEKLWSVYNVQRAFSQWGFPTRLMEFPSVPDVNLHEVSKGVPCPLGIYSVSWVEQPPMRGCTPGLHGGREHWGVWPSTVAQTATCLLERLRVLTQANRPVFGGRPKKACKAACGSFLLAMPQRVLIPWPGWHLCPLHWKPSVLIAAPLGKSPVIPFK